MVSLAVVAALAGAVVDLRVEGGLRWVFAGAIASGCLLTVSGPGLVAAMVEPPVGGVLAVGVGAVLTGHGAAARRPCWPPARGSLRRFRWWPE